MSTNQLTESRIAEMATAGMEKAINEGLFGDMKQYRKSIKANKEMKQKHLASLLTRAGAYDLKPQKIFGDEGYLMTLPMDEAVRIAKELKPEGVKMFVVRQKLDKGEGEIQDATVFACFGPYYGGVSEE